MAGASHEFLILESRHHHEKRVIISSCVLLSQRYAFSPFPQTIITKTYKLATILTYKYYKKKVFGGFRESYTLTPKSLSVRYLEIISGQSMPYFCPPCPHRQQKSERSYLPPGREIWTVYLLPAEDNFFPGVQGLLKYRRPCTPEP